MSSTPRSSQTRSVRLSLESLEDRTTPTFLPRAGFPTINFQRTTVPAGGLSIAAGNLRSDPSDPIGFVQNEYVTGTGPGTEGLVRVWKLNGTGTAGGLPLLTIDPFPGFTGGINVAVGDVLGDGGMEIIAAVAGSGPPHVKVFDANGQLLSSFYAFNPAFLGGVNIAVGNVLGGIGGGGFSGGTVSSAFKQEIIIGAAAGNAPHVVVTDGGGTIFRSFLAFDVGYLGGVTVAAGNIDPTRSAAYAATGIDTNAYDEIIIGAATNIPHVKAFDVFNPGFTERLSFLAYGGVGGVTVAVGSTDNQRGGEIYVSQVVPRTIPGNPTVRVFNSFAQLQLETTPFPSDYTHVLNMTVGFFRGPYISADDDTLTNSVFFLTQDLAIVTGDGPFGQQPRLYFGVSNSPAGANGP